MYAQHHLRPSAFTTRANKTNSSLENSNISKQKLQTPSNIQLIPSYNNHRKYKLSHSQVIRLSKQRIPQLRQKRENQKSQQILNNFNNDFEQLQQLKQHPQQKFKARSSKTNYKIQKSRNFQISEAETLHIQIIQFQLTQSVQKDVSLLQQFSSIQQNKYEVICFEVHNKIINEHYRGEFMYRTLNQPFRIIFPSIDQIFNYIVIQLQREGFTNSQGNSLIKFNRSSFQLQISVYLQCNASNSLQLKNTKPKERILKIQLLPHATLQIVDDHRFEDQEKNQLNKRIHELSLQLSISKQQNFNLKKQNDSLKSKLRQQKHQIQKEKAQIQILIQNFQRISKASEPKQYFFEFVPDPKVKNYAHFTFKNQILKKVKNDLKWDQLSSQAPLPKSGRHYFSFNIKTFTPDFMFGIVTLKGKDTLNAFNGYQTVCLYAGKNINFIYQRGKHYKVNSCLKKGDTLYVIVDREKSIIEWIKKKERPEIEEKIEETSNQQQRNLSKQGLRKTLAQMHTSKESLQNDTLSIHHSTRNRKSSQQLIVQPSLSRVSQNTLPNQFITQQTEFMHSTNIPQQFLSHELYAYIQMYNINQPLKLNERR